MCEVGHGEALLMRCVTETAVASTLILCKQQAGAGRAAEDEKDENGVIIKAGIKTDRGQR